MPRALAAMRGIKAQGGWGVVCTEEVEIHHRGDLAPNVREGELSIVSGDGHLDVGESPGMTGGSPGTGLGPARLDRHDRLAAADPPGRPGRPGAVRTTSHTSTSSWLPPR